MSSTPHEIGTLIVVILKANHLPNKRTIGKQDPYCLVSVNGEKQRTKVIKRGGQHPEWDEEIRFKLYEDDALMPDGPDGAPPPLPPKDGKRNIKGGTVMKLSCFADDPREPSLIGEADVDLTEVLTKGETDEWFTLTNKEKFAGKVYIELTFWSNEPAPKKKVVPVLPKANKEYIGRAESQQRVWSYPDAGSVYNPPPSRGPRYSSGFMPISNSNSSSFAPLPSHPFEPSSFAPPLTHTPAPPAGYPPSHINPATSYPHATSQTPAPGYAPPLPPSSAGFHYQPGFPPSQSQYSQFQPQQQHNPPPSHIQTPTPPAQQGYALPPSPSNQPPASLSHSNSLSSSTGPESRPLPPPPQFHAGQGHQSYGLPPGASQPAHPGSYGPTPPGASTFQENYQPPQLYQDGGYDEGENSARPPLHTTYDGDGTRPLPTTANGTVQVPIPFTLPLQFTDNSAPLSNPSFPPEECIHPENQDAATTPGDVQSLLASWERRCLLLTIVAPDGDSQGLSSRQREDLKVVEAQITTFLTHILDSQDARHAAQELEGSSAQSFVDAIQNVLDWGTLADASSRAKARQLMRKVAEAGEQLPSSLFITGVNDHDEHPTFGGGFGDVYQASYDGKRVALKRIRTFTADSTTRRNRLQFYKEALVWQSLRHRFILPLLGIDRSTFAPSFCMVSPWMKYGTVLKHLQDHGRGDVNRLLLEVALGLEYLHSLNIVHGDLRGSNILISDDGNACLSDFGLASPFSDTDSTAGITASSNRAGSVRWFAPELIEPESFGCKRFVRTTASDVYAYACVCLELYTGRPPFAHLQDVATMLRVIAGDRPEQPTTISDVLWQLVTAAWAPESHARPSIHEIVVALEGGAATHPASST